MAQNQAAWILEKGKLLEVGPAEMPKPGPNEVLIKNHAVAMNPIDVAQAKFGRFVKKMPHVVGNDLAGEVQAVGAQVSGFKAGDRVVGHAQHILTGNAEHAAFAHYTKVDFRNVALLPDGVSYAEAAVLPLGLDTATAALYQSKFLGLAWPTAGTPVPTGEVVVIYGGSSSIGLSAAQLARASGVRVISIASPHNFDICKTSGASEVFDYKSSSVDEDVVAAIGKDKLVGIFNAIFSDDSWEHCYKILEPFGGGKIAAAREVPESLPANIEAGQVFGVGEFTYPLWQNFLGKALANGQIKCLPPPLVVGKGLNSIQAALDKLAAGVSAQKVVVEL